MEIIKMCLHVFYMLVWYASDDIMYISFEKGYEI